MIIIGVGANLDHPRHGDPRATCVAALAALDARADVAVTRVSRWYESAPVPISDQPWFVNTVAEVETALAAPALLEVLHQVEARFGRVRGEKNAPRTLDLDLVDYRGESHRAPPGPALPHPRMHHRAFVLLPLRDMVPDWRHPGSGAGIDALIGALDPGAVIRPLPPPK